MVTTGFFSETLFNNSSFYRMDFLLGFISLWGFVGRGLSGLDVVVVVDFCSLWMF